MLSNAKCKSKLRDKKRKYTEEEIEQIKQLLYQLGELTLIHYKKL